MTHTIESNWQGDMLFNVEEPGGIVNIDSDPEFGGQNKGVLPKPLMLSALAGCTGMDVVSLLKKMHAEVADFKIHVNGQLTEEHPKYYNKVDVIYKFCGTDFKKDKIEKAVSLSVDRYCGVMEMFRQFSELTTTIQYFEK
ncbi:MAG: OsmC family protein [Flavobacteriales bacterium]|jgi:putative redox protein|nr:OsmC family protein [Flavobacteriales bacterium]